MTKYLKIPILAAILSSIGCSVIIKVPAYTPQAPPVAEAFLVGVGKSDITPPPGYPLGGHSIGGRMARGYWTHLFARAFYFQKPGGRPLALISCELFAIPAGLHARVARELSIPPESLLIAATHTHHGPAGYMSSAVFNFGGLLPGYDERLSAHLTSSIVEAYRAAQRDAQQPGAASIVLRTGAALNLQRNRAIDAFFRNPNQLINEVLTASRNAGMTCPFPAAENQCPRFQAADPTLHVLEVLHDDRRIGLLVFYAIHNTAMSHDCTLYQSDLAGYAMHQLEMADPRNPVVAGFFNGAEGDISPRWETQDRGDVVRLGGALAAAVTNLLGKPGEVQRDPIITAARQVFPAVPPSGSTAALTLPRSGVGELGGAEDGRTVLYAYGWHGGVTVAGSDPKMSALDLHNMALLKILQGILGAPKNYPQRIPLATAMLGTLSLAAIPTEMTAVQGWQLRNALQQATGRRFVTVGLANEYIGYTTTEAEYGAQNYEAASTMYGPKQGAVLGELLTGVATNAPPSSSQVAKLRFDAGVRATYPFGPELFGERYNVPYEDLEPVMGGPQHRLDDSAHRFQWSEPSTSDWESGHRAITILREDATGWRKITDDRGFEILTVLVDGRLNRNSTDPKADRRVWTAIWSPDPNQLDRTATYVFRVEPPGRNVVCSAAFQIMGAVTRVPAAPLNPADCPPWRKE